jgi:signal transduction histidine kinase
MGTDDEVRADREEPAQPRGKTLLGLSKTSLDPELLAALSCRRDSFHELDARALLEQVRERVRPDADAKDVDVLIYCTCGGICAQPTALSEALHQLLKNAIHATRKSHPVVVHARETREGDVLFEIQDTGEGMRPHVLGRLARPGGTGRGVALAWAVVEQHGGLLRFESAPGVGTTATIWLPEMATRSKSSA